MAVCGKKVEKMWRREKVWYGVPRCPTVFLGVSPTTEEALLLPYRRTPHPALREKSPAEVLINQQIRTIHVATETSQKCGYKAGGLVYAHDYRDQISQ